MEELRGAGHAVGEYIGGGRADMGLEDDEGTETIDDQRTESVESGIEPDFDDGLDEDHLTEDAHPLLFLFDTETTGLNIYEDHIVEIAAKVTGVPLSTVTQPSYSSLVHTPRNIPSKGIELYVFIYLCTYFHTNSY